MGRAVFGWLVVTVMVTGCGAPASPTPNIAATVSAAVASTVAAIPTATAVPTVPPAPTATATTPPTATAVPPQPSATVPPPTATALPKTTERAESGGFAMTLHAVADPTPVDRFLKPKDGMRFVATDVTIENTTAPQFYAQPFDVRLKTADNREYLVAVGTASPALVNSQLAKGEKARGWVNFEIPADAQLAVLQYSPPGFRERVVFDLKG